MNKRAINAMMVGVSAFMVLTLNAAGSPNDLSDLLPGVFFTAIFIAATYDVLSQP